MPRTVDTHFVDFNQPGKRSARALCGALVALKEGTVTPTCMKCRDLLLYRDGIVDALAADLHKDRQ